MRTSIVVRLVSLVALAGCTTENTPAQVPTCNCPSPATAAASPSSDHKESYSTTLPPIAEQRLAAIDKAFELTQARMKSGAASITEAVTMARWWHDVFHDSKVTGPVYVQRAEKHVALMKDIVGVVENLHKAAVVPLSDVLRAQYLLLEAEQWLEQAKAGEAP